MDPVHRLDRGIKPAGDTSFCGASPDCAAHHPGYGRAGISSSANGVASLPNGEGAALFRVPGGDIFELNPTRPSCAIA
jgi:hypothetical protein